MKKSSCLTTLEFLNLMVDPGGRRLYKEDLVNKLPGRNAGDEWLCLLASGTLGEYLQSIIKSEF